MVWYGYDHFLWVEQDDSMYVQGYKGCSDVGYEA